MEKVQAPVHQRLLFGSVLAAAAGSIDSYTYLVHGEVFAGLQTGNLILLGSKIGLGEFNQVWRYLIAILAFMFGTILMRIFQYQFEGGKFHTNRPSAVLKYELVLVLIVALISSWLPNLVSTALLSITAAAQLQEFRQLKGGPFTSLMMTGNIRTLAESFYDWVGHGDQKARGKLADIGAIMVAFAFGAGLVAVLVSFLHGVSIIVTAVFLAIDISFLRFAD